jgi:hypothetical protein
MLFLLQTTPGQFNRIDGPAWLDSVVHIKLFSPRGPRGTSQLGHAVKRAIFAPKTMRGGCERLSSRPLAPQTLQESRGGGCDLCFAAGPEWLGIELNLPPNLNFRS